MPTLMLADMETLPAFYSCAFPGCAQQRLEAHQLYVPELRWIYHQLGVTRRPLQEEMASFGRCRAHMYESVVGVDFNRRHGINEAVTLNLVFEAAGKNFLRNMDEKDARRQRRIERHARQRSDPAERQLHLVRPKLKNYGDAKPIVAAVSGKKRNKKKEGDKKRGSGRR